MKKVLAALLMTATLFGAVSCTGSTGNQKSDDTTNDYQSKNTSTESEPKETESNVESGSGETDANTELETNDKTTENVVLDKNRHYEILFIGNSYTYYSTMPENIFAPIAKAAGYDVTVEKITKGGWYLIDSAKSTDEVGAKVEAALNSKSYDYVILQEQSTCPALSPDKFYTGVRNLVTKIRANGATPILYGTWGRKTGSSDLTTNNWTNESMTWMTAAAYTAIANELGIEVAYAGLAFYDVYNNNGDKVNIYNDDMSHPSYAGSYLAAMTIFAKLTGTDPITVEYNGTLADDAAAILKEAARCAVFETPEIPDSYKTSYEGVKYAYDYTVDTSKMKNLTSFPSSSLISVLTGGTYPNGKSFSGILGTKNAIASTKYSTTGLSDEDKADIADIGYGVSVIGIEKMDSSSKGYTTAVENLVNGHWGSSMMACFEFDDKHYNINGEVDESSDYTGLITLNFGSAYKFDAMGFASGNLKGFPGVAEVYVSDDGLNWTLVPTSCWDNVNGTKLKSCGKMTKDPWNGNTASVTCLFDMEGVTGQYIRIGVIIGRNDNAAKYNTVNTREILVYGEKVN